MYAIIIILHTQFKYICVSILVFIIIDNIIYSDIEKKSNVFNTVILL